MAREHVLDFDKAKARRARRDNRVVLKAFGEELLVATSWPAEFLAIADHLRSERDVGDELSFDELTALARAAVGPDNFDLILSHSPEADDLRLIFEMVVGLWTADRKPRWWPWR
jgi:hypothetical protein